MAAYCQVYGVIHFTSPAGWLPVHRDQLRAQRSVTSTEKNFTFFCHSDWLFVGESWHLDRFSHFGRAHDRGQQTPTKEVIYSMHRIYNLLDSWHPHTPCRERPRYMRSNRPILCYGYCSSVMLDNSLPLPPHTLLTKSTGSVTLRVLWAQPDSQSYTPAGLSNSQQSARNINTQ